ncbi:hypothetical protein [Actinoplanes regularis]|nr:hypothetical protein [Actinoplanes regularis]
MAATSTPFVGSSSRTAAGPVPSHFASSTFCWLPPESCSTGGLRTSETTR